MVKVILKVLVALLVLAYGALFLSWNMAPQEVIGFRFQGEKFTQALPLGSLVFIGLIAGAVIMAVAAWSAWSTQKGVADKHAATIRKAKSKLQAQLDEINELRDQVARLESELESLQAGDGTWGRAVCGEAEADARDVGAATAAPAVTEPAQPVAAAADGGEVDDPDVI